MGSYGIPHLFVPGNHDPAFTYAREAPELLHTIAGTVNMHNCCYQLLPHLWIVGFGGSVPVRLADGTPYKSSYPFTTDMEDEVSRLMALVPKGDSIILLTHCPPSKIGEEKRSCLKQRKQCDGPGQIDEGGVLRK